MILTIAKLLINSEFCKKSVQVVHSFLRLRLMTVSHARTHIT